MTVVCPETRVPATEVVEEVRTNSPAFASVPPEDGESAIDQLWKSVVATVFPEASSAVADTW
jgi:hypothetical protein